MPACPVGEWNALRLTVIGPSARLELNGALAWTSDEIEPATGYLGLQAEVPGGGQSRFRNIRVTEVGCRSLFNGSDLTNWERSGADLAGS